MNKNEVAGSNLGRVNRAVDEVTRWNCFEQEMSFAEGYFKVTGGSDGIIVT